MSGSIEKLKNNKVIDAVIVIGLFVAMTICLVGSGNADYKIIHDIYYFIAASLLSVFVLWERKAKIINPVSITFTVCLFAGMAVFFYIKGYLHWNYYQYVLFLFFRAIMYGLLVLFVIDLVINRDKKLVIVYKNISLFIIGVIVIIGIGIFDIHTSLAVLIPFSMFFLTYMELERFKRVLLYLSYSIYSVFLVCFVVSILFFRNNMLNERYVGCFRYLLVAAVLSMAALIGVFYIFDYFYEKIKRKKKLIILCSMGAILPLAAELLVADKIALIGLIVVLGFVLAFYSPNGFGWQKRSFAIIISIISVCIMSVLALVIMAKTGYMSKMLNGEVNGILSRAFQYIFLKLMMAVDETDKLTFGSIIPILDSFTGGRLTIFAEGIKTVKMFKATELGVYISETEWMAPHNTYLSWLQLYGWVAGLSIVVLYVFSILYSIVGIFKGKRHYMFGLLWMIFCGIIFIAESEFHYNMTVFLLILFQYPLLQHEKQE